MENSSRKNIVIIGGGVGGYHAAIRAARLGGKVILIEKETVGGVCLNRGCIPTKSLLHGTAEFKNSDLKGSPKGAKRGISNKIKSVHEEKKRIVQHLVNGVDSLLKSNNITVIKGTAEFTGSKTVKIKQTDQVIKGDAFVIATGSIPIIPNIPGIQSPGVITSDDAMNIESPPKRMIVIGGGNIGVEFAQIFNNLGCEVTIAEMLPQILPNEDHEIAMLLEKIMKKDGIGIFTNCKAEKIEQAGKQRKVHLTVNGKMKKLEVEKVLVCVGRQSNCGGLNIEKTGVKTSAKGTIVVDDRMKTNVEGVYAIGDVVGGAMLAHKAMAEGECVAHNIMGIEQTMSGKVIPRAVYTTPEIACAGHTETSAGLKKENLKVGRFPFSMNGKALTEGSHQGMVKIIAEKKYNQILGISIIGPSASSLLGEATLAVQMELPLEVLMETVHAHPTLSEAIMEAAHDAYNSGSIHLPPK